MSGFSIDWLDLREPADLCARNPELLNQIRQWLAAVTADDRLEPIVVDLGAGTGSTLRAFNKLGIHNVVWRLVDHDGDLLDEALRRHRQDYIIEDYQADLSIVAELPLGAARLVTASALFDLASANFVDQLVLRLKQNNNGLYAALNYDGTTAWHPTHPFDAQVLATFNQDQLGDKGMGPALGPQASAYLRRSLEASGFTVSTGSSPWLLDCNDKALVVALIEGISLAVMKGYRLDPAELEAWLQFRLAHCATGTCTIGHQDLVALPK